MPPKNQMEVTDYSNEASTSTGAGAYNSVPQEDQKRGMSGPDNYDVGDSKRPRTEVETIKVEALRYVFCLCNAVCDKVGLTLEDIIDKPYAMTMLYHRLYNIHQYVRIKEATTSTSAVANKPIYNMEFKIHGAVYSMESDVIMEVFNAAIIAAQVDRTKVFKDYHTIVCHLELFYARSKELQKHPNRWTGTKDYNKSLLKMSSEYRHYATGLAWDGNLRSTLARHTSDVCQLILLSDAKENNYSNKHKEAVIRAYDYLDGITEIATYFQRNEPTLRGGIIIDQFCRLSALHPDKHKRRVALPFSFVMKCLIANGTFCAEECDKICFSNKKGTLTYNSIGSVKGNKNPDLYKQWLFHCCFGTHGEDVAVLQGTTDLISWNTKSQFKDFFKDLSSSLETVDIVPIKVKYYSKRTIAYPAYTFRGNVQTCADIVFAGKRIRSNIIFMSTFMRTVNDVSKLVRHGIDEYSLHEYMVRVIDRVTNIINAAKEKGEIIGGTTSWFNIDGATYKKYENGTKTNLIFEEKGICFYNVTLD